MITDLQFGEMLGSLKAIEQNQSAALVELKELRKDFNSHAKDDGDRFLDLEKRWSFAKGAFYLIPVVVSAVIAGVVTWFFGGH